MEVILTENVPNLGFVGDVVKVRDGYARNFLLPKRKALIASKDNVKQFEHQKRVVAVKKQKKKAEAEQLKSRIQALEINVAHQAESDKLFGSVTATELQAKFLESGFEIDRKMIILAAPIRVLGEHEVKVQLHPDVYATVKVVVSKA